MSSHPYAFAGHSRLVAVRPQPLSSRMAGIAAACVFSGTMLYGLATGIGGVSLTAPNGPIDVVFVPPEPGHVDPIPPPARPTIKPFEVFIPPDKGFVIDNSEPPPTGITVDRTPLREPPAVPDVGPRPIRQTIPAYPELSRRLGEEGTVLLQLFIDVDGKVQKAVVARSSGFARLDDTAQGWAVGHWRFSPALKNGKKVASETTIDVKFQIR